MRKSEESGRVVKFEEECVENFYNVHTVIEIPKLK